MKSAKLEIVIHCAKGLQDMKHFSSMNPVAIVSINGDDGKQVFTEETPVAKKGDCNPIWDCSMDFDITSINTTKYTLFFKLEHRGSWTERLIGEVEVPFDDLLKGDERARCRAGYPVTIPCGEKKGEIIFSYKFSKLGSVSNDGSGTSKVPRRRLPPRRKKLGELEKIATKLAKQAAYSFAVGIAQGATMFFTNDSFDCETQHQYGDEDEYEDDYEDEDDDYDDEYAF